jgi:hypothetical protein
MGSVKHYGTMTRWGYAIPADDDEFGTFMFVKELIRCRGVTFSRIHVGGRTMYEYADHGDGERYYFPEARQLECFDLFYTMAIFEIAGMLLSDFEEGLLEAVAEKYLKNITEWKEVA